MKAGKVWGETLCILANPSLEFHRISAKPGHRCSKHKHKTKFNGFFVESGTLKITVWKDSGLIDETLLYDQEFMAVPPGEYHQFEALQDTVAFEVYWAEFSHDDIEREDTGE